MVSRGPNWKKNKRRRITVRPPPTTQSGTVTRGFFISNSSQLQKPVQTFKRRALGDLGRRGFYPRERHRVNEFNAMHRNPDASYRTLSGAATHIVFENPRISPGTGRNARLFRPCFSYYRFF